MSPHTEELFNRISEALTVVRDAAEQDTNEVVVKTDIPSAIAHFDILRDHVRATAEKVSALQKIVDALSYETIPTMMTNANIKTITIPGVGRTTVNVRWSAKMLDKEAGFGWLRQTNNAGLITLTVNAQTLGAFAGTEALEGRPLPSDIFKVSAAPFISITKA